MSDAPFEEVEMGQPDESDLVEGFTLDDDELETSDDADFEDVEEDLDDIPF